MTKAEATVDLPADHCLLVVAARESMAEARAFVAAHPQLAATSFYLGDNGWIAISTGSIPNAAAQAQINFLISRGAPPDTYCANGRGLSPIGSVNDAPLVEGDRTEIWSELNAQPYSQVEKRYLQAALAYTKDNNGLIDGEWGPISQRAIERYSQREFSREPKNADAGFWALLMRGQIEEGDWRSHWFQDFATGLYLPSNGLTVLEEEPRLLHLYHNSLALDLTLVSHTAGA